MILIKRAYESFDPSDGTRVLVDRLWPRGLRKDEAHLDAWLKDVAPSDELRTWFAHDPERWSEFRVRYRKELRSRATREAIDELAQRSRRATVTLVYGARDERHNNAVVLRELIERAARRPRRVKRARSESHARV